MSRAQAESVIKNIIREIAQECANKGQAVSETLVAFMVGFSCLSCLRTDQPSFMFLYLLQVKAVVLDPDNEFNVDRTLTKDDVQKLIMVGIGKKNAMYPYKVQDVHV